MKKEEDRGMGAVSFRAFVIGVLLSGVFAWITVLRDNADPGGDPNTYISGNLIPVLPHLMLLIAGILVNPILRRLKVARLFTKAELLLVFVMTAVSAGIASWGLTGRLVPEAGALSNTSWNKDQASWDINAMPFLNENYFVSEKGTQAAARKLREAHIEFEEARDTYQAARDLTLGRTEMSKAEAALAELANLPDSDDKIAREKTIRWSRTQAQSLLETAEEKWDQVGRDLNPELIVETYPDKIEALKEARDALRDELKELNEVSFAAIEEFRKGLPPEKRATPGFFYTGGEGISSYKARFKRYRIGSRSRRVLHAAADELSSVVEQGGAIPSDWAATVREAADMLADISDIPRLAALHEKKSAKLEQTEDSIAEMKSEGRRLRQLRRHSGQTQFEAFNDRIEELDAEIAGKEEEANELRDVVENQLAPLLEVRERVKSARQELASIADDAGSVNSTDYPALQERVQAVLASYPAFDASARRYWLGDSKWGIWMRPLANWVVLIFIGYVVLMTFNLLIFRQWAHNEKLIYPLAEVTTVLAGGCEPEGDGKSIYRSGLFWTGFAVAFGILGWNYLANNSIIPNIKPVKLEFLWLGYVGNGIFKGLGATYFCLIFVVIGITFLVPANISFSLWFFEILYLTMLVVMAWMGYGSNRWALGNPGRTGIGAGAMVVFGIVILWTCRQYLLCAFRPGALKGLPEDEARELRVSSMLFLGASLVLMLMLSFGLGANLFFVFVYFLLALTMAIALMRAVAEGGILGIEGGGALETIMKVFFGFKGFFTGILIAPAALFWGHFFGGTKAFIGPMMANSLKVREQMRIKRLSFHGAIAAGIVIATIVSVITLVMISYDRGADSLHGWLNTFHGKSSINAVAGAGAAAMAEPKPVPAKEKYWMLTGAVLMGGLLLARRKVFGIPHPIGLLMIMNKSMYGFWGSILLGWIFKSIVSKYCSQEQYIAIRRFFIGLIVGHLLAILFGWDAMEFHWG